MELPIHFISQLEIIAGNMTMNWEQLEHKLQSVDPELQHKKDGIEMFHGELCVIKLDSNGSEVFYSSILLFIWINTIIIFLCIISL